MKNKRYYNLALLVIGILVIFFVYTYKTGYMKGLAAGTISTKSTKTLETKPVIEKSEFVGYYTVTHIVDGDTIDVLVDTKKVRIRLLGVNTPESVAQNRPVECYGKEASVYTSSLLANMRVRLELDPDKPEKDEYGRVLAYVFREDGLLVNKDLIEQGYGYEYTYHNEKYKYQTEFKKAQTQARLEKMGLWATDTCAGKK